MNAPPRAAVAALALSLLVAPAAAARRKPAAAPAAPAAITAASFGVQRHVLANGLVVLTREDHSVPAVTFWQWYRVGSRDERPGITGISHVFEHMMFNGSRNVPPKEYDRILESNGGNSNAFTDRDMTAYYEDIVADRLDVALGLDADRMTELSLLPEVLASEIEVVKEERRRYTDNDIEGLLDEQLWATAFVASPYRWPVVGWMGDLGNIRREDCVEYFRRHYAPNNCILVLVGDFQTADALARLERAFGGITAQAAPPPVVDSEPPQAGERRAEVHHAAENVTFMVGWKAPPARSPDAPVLDVLSAILSSGESSRLRRALEYDRPIALDVRTAFTSSLLPGLFTATVELRPGEAGEAGLAAMDSVIARLAAEGPTERELTRARNLLEAEFVKGLKTNNGVGLQLGFYEHVHGDHREMFEMIPRWRAVSAEDCRRVARATFDRRRRTVAMLVPEAGPAEAQP